MHVPNFGSFFLDFSSWFSFTETHSVNVCQGKKQSQEALPHATRRVTAVTKARRDPDATTSPLPPAPLLPRALQEGGMLPGGLRRPRKGSGSFTGTSHPGSPPAHPTPVRSPHICRSGSETGPGADARHARGRSSAHAARTAPVTLPSAAAYLAALVMKLSSHLGAKINI